MMAILLRFLRRFTFPRVIVRLLPGTSEDFGPPRRWATVAAYARTHSVEVRTVRPPEAVPVPRARYFGEPAPDYLPRESLTVPAQHVLRLHQATIYGVDANLVTADDTFLTDTAWKHFHEDPPTFRGRPIVRRRRALPRKRLQGRTAVIASDWSSGGFGHFVTDALPRWRSITAAGFTATDFDHFVVFRPMTATCEYLLRAIGVPLDRTVGFEITRDIVCDEAVAATFPGLAPAISPTTPAWLRTLTPPPSTHTRIYLSRAGYVRHPANAAEIESLLARRGFATLHGERGLDALEACAGARVAVGVEGANLFNLCFMPPGGRVVLLVPNPWMIPYIPFVCQSAGLELAIVIARRDSLQNTPVFPLDAVEAALDWAVEVPSP